MADTDASTRRRTIVRIARERSDVGVAALTDELRAEPATVRRDLRLLEAQGLIRRSYGRISAVESSRFETPLSWRTATENPERDAVAAAAIGEIRDATSLYIDEGATGAAVARLLPTDRTFTVVTSSIPAATTLSTSSPHEVILLGGRVRGRTLGSVDFWARDMLAGFTIDLAFLGANGVTVEGGLSTPDPAVAAVKSMAVQVSRRRVFVGEHTKFGVTTFARFARADEIDVYVTGDRLPAAVERQLRDLGASVVRA